MITIIVNLSLLSGCPLLSLLPDVYMKWQKLSQVSCSQVFKPSAVGSHSASSSGQDELLIPDTELQRIHTLGRKHTHTHTIKGKCHILNPNVLKPSHFKMYKCYIHITCVLHDLVYKQHAHVLTQTSSYCFQLHTVVVLSVNLCHNVTHHYTE